MTSIAAPELIATDCPLCKSEKSRRVLETRDNLCGIPGVYYVDRCDECGHLFMNPRPTAATLHRCYPEHYGPHQTESVPAAPSAAAADSSRPWYLRVLPLRHVPGLKTFYHWWMEDLGQPLPDSRRSEGATLLELGCSTGAYLSRSRQIGWDVTGIEPSESASEKARRAGHNVYTGTLEDVDLGEKRFDAVAAWMVLEHTIDPVETLQRFADLLHPDGQLLFSVPNAGCWERFFFGSCWYVWESPRHLHHFTPSQLRRILSDAGFAEIRVQHQRNLLNLFGSTAICLRRWSLTRSLGDQLLRYPDNPRQLIQFALSPLAHFLSWIGQGGRLTVTARKI